MQTVIQLFNQFVPNNYRLSLNLNRVNRTFDGSVIIQGSSKSAATDILLHSKDLNIESVVVDGKKADFTFGKNDTLVISHPDICNGKHIVVIVFNGQITDSMHGLYPCYYDHNGTKKELLATQFESHHAREVFPCIDEPLAKATFDVTLITETAITVLGNMPIKTQSIEKEHLITTFETTPIMSSYLLAWVVGELHKKTSATKSGVEVNVWATPAQASNNLDFALDIATRSIDFFDEYFGVPYPLPKCDHVALPDFSSGAMENWGLITYREIALLTDPDTTSIANKHYVATVIAHEISHQWFGNLVTMKWWNDLWLNESFATFIEYVAINAIEPDWNVWLDFASFESMSALRRDSLDGVQSVQTDVNHPDEIGTLFDGAIVYAKGARLIQMLQHYIGDNAFRIGIKNYFKANAYKNTEALDLWTALSDASDKDIASFMNPWISQPGFPVLHVSSQGNQILLSQERLSNQPNTKSSYLWPITLNSNCSEMPNILNTQSLMVARNNSLPLRFNVGNYAHFITHYSSDFINQIITQLKSKELSTIDRLQLLNEQTILANAGIISNATIVNLLDSYKNETTEPVWNIIGMAIGELKKFVDDNQIAESKLRLLARSLSQSEYQRLGWAAKPKESETDKKLRSIIIGLTIFSEDSDAILFAKNLYNSTSIDKLDPELRSLILSVAVRYSNDDDTIKTLLELYTSTDSAELKQDVCIGLTSTRSPDTISMLLNCFKNTSVIRTQDTFRWMIYLIRNKYARTQTWQWIRDNWEWIKITFSGDKSYNDYPRYVATSLSTDEQLQQYRDFFMALHSDPALSRTIDMGINEIKNRVDIIKRDEPSVIEALLKL